MKFVGWKTQNTSLLLIIGFDRIILIEDFKVGSGTTVYLVKLKKPDWLVQLRVQFKKRPIQLSNTTETIHY